MKENDELKAAWEFVEETGRSVFLTGKAGTGKTTFLKKVVEQSHKRAIVVAPTGIAAINAGGVTIHSFFQLPFHPFIPGMKVESKFAFSKEKRNIIRTIDLLIIDEISMVRADLLDAIDSVLRRFRGSQKPFGGVQLLMIGDLQQLSPVVTEDEASLLSTYYESPYFFNSHALKRIPYLTIELKDIFRQEDADFISILNAIRDGNPSNDVIKKLNTRYLPDFEPNKDEGYIRLTTHNNIANNYNELQLEKIDEKSYSFEAVVSGNFPEYSYPTELVLELKVGAQVMFIKNDPYFERRYYNGKIGHIVEIMDDIIYVQCPGEDESIDVVPLEWENSKYTINPSTQELETKVEGVFRQYPLRLAWAITIHKSQGLTFDKAIIDAALSFAPGQVYVALSRCRSLEGIVLATPLRQNSVITDYRIEEYIDYQEIAAQKSLAQLDAIKEDYYKELLGDLFDFRNLGKLEEKMLRVCIEFPKDVAVGLKQRHNDILNILNKKVVHIGVRWQGLINNKNFTELTSVEFLERIKNGCEYFLKEIDEAFGETLETYKNLELSNKELAKKYTEAWTNLNTEITEQKLLLESLSTINFSTESYLKLRQKAIYEASNPRKIRDKAKNDSKKNISEKLSKTKETKKAKKEKPKKEDTKVTTFKLFKQGLSVKEIAKERDYTEQTIIRHLAHFVAKGMIDASELISQDRIDKICEVLEETGKLTKISVIKEACPPDITYNDIIITIASLEQ